MLDSPRTVRISAGAFVAAALIAGAAGCASSSPTAPSSSASVAASDVNSGPHNAEDVSFLQGMIPHHEQAIVMAKLVPSRTTDQALISLASQIEGAQGPEIAQMKSWLSQWGEPASASSGGHGMGGGQGMMSADQMAQLEKAQGAEFNRMWLEMMIAHHEGAVEMANQELAKGENPQAKALAQAIVTGQTKEIAAMKKMLGQ